MNYLIKTPGRTGSHIITSYLRNNNINCKHCQELWVPEHTSDWVFINNKRRVWWDMACSRIVSSYTKQYGPYNIKNLKDLKIKTDIESLIDSAGYAKTWYNTFDMQSKKYQWKKVINIYYEDIVRDTDSLKVIADLDTSVALEKAMTSPYVFKDVIKDYEKLKIQFIQWQQDIGLSDE